MQPSDVAVLYEACTSAALRRREQAYRDLGRLLYRVAWARVRGDPRLHHLAEDCTQEALVTIWKHLEAGRGPDKPASFVAWSTTIVVNKVREAIRRLSPAPEVRRAKRVALNLLTSLDAPAVGDRSTPAAVTTAAGEDIEDAMAYRAIRDLVREIQTIPEISANSRIVLLKGFIEGWDDDELAALLGTTKPNVHVIRCRDLAKLRAAEGFIGRLRAFYA